MPIQSYQALYQLTVLLYVYYLPGTCIVSLIVAATSDQDGMFYIPIMFNVHLNEFLIGHLVFVIF